MTTLWRDRRSRFGIIVLGGAVLLAVAAPLVTSGPPTAAADIVHTRFLHPFGTDPVGVRHWLGTDRLGRDVWAQLIYGARVSLAVGVLSVVLAAVLGTLVGAVAAWRRGPVGAALLALTDFGLALPRVVLLLLLAALWPPSAELVVLLLGFTGWMTVARLMHGEVRGLAVRSFVDAALSLGARRSRVLWHHILPNALTPLIVSAALGVGTAIQLEAGLSFLGLGVQPPTASWGAMIASGRDTLVNAPWVAAAPGIALVLVTIACALLGDALNARR